MMFTETVLQLLWSRAEPGDRRLPDLDDSELKTLGQAKRLTAGGPAGSRLENLGPPFSYRQ